jgi:hypothetical protein
MRLPVYAGTSRMPLAIAMPPAVDIASMFLREMPYCFVMTVLPFLAAD